MIILGAILAGPAVFGGVMLIILALALFEFSRITHRTGNAPALPLLLASSGLVYIASVPVILHLLPPGVFYFGLAVLPAAILLQLSGKMERNWERTGMLLLGFTYLAIPLVLLNLLYYKNFSFEDPKPFLLLGLFLIIWINDTFAYITGSLFGRTRLARHISPQKTVEGAIGGLVFSLAAGYALSVFLKDFSLQQWMTISVITVLFGTFGDLFESVLKRKAGLKESGRIIPGHGGILDRIDSILMATPFVFVYVYFIL